ncbi:unnamed protein product [Coffea canephora]|uniref:DH200=94 genomic scaffold, scaffold_8964 n=1 Tax=Coffea canephora TaxID=49390 RepID=A0A068VMT8_COFCA|nr:unnamed protein product [Coffea canephora]
MEKEVIFQENDFDMKNIFSPTKRTLSLLAFPLQSSISSWVESRMEEGEGAGVVGSSSEFHADEHPMELESQLEEEHEVDDEGEGTTANTMANIEGEEEDDDDEDEEEEGYKFRFSDDMDPLAFTKEDASGLQPYEQFQRLEHHYEALAAKKRKARLQAIPQGYPLSLLLTIC